MALQMLAPHEYCQTQEVVDPIRLYQVPLLGPLYRARVTRTLGLLPAGKRVLEIGYGSGVSFLSLAEKFDEIHGVDLHGRQDNVYRSFTGRTLNLHLRKGNILELPYDDETFDAALTISVHEHLRVEDQDPAFAEVQRVLRRGGVYVMGVPGFNWMMTTAFFLLGYNIYRHHLSTEREVLGAMRRAFDIDASVYSPRFWPKSMTSYVSARGIKR